MSGAGLMHKGQPIKLGGMVYTIPPLSLGAVELYEEQIEKMEQLPRPQQLRLIVDLAFAALRRNYPAITRAEVAELIDLANAHEVYCAVMAVTMPPADPEASKAGELGAMADGTGSTSTPTSPPVLDTPLPTAEST